MVRRRHVWRRDGGNAFIPDPGEGPATVPDDLAQELAEEFLASATSGEYASSALDDETGAEEIGGPFIETSGRVEFADGIDESNPVDATREPVPLAVGSGVLGETPAPILLAPAVDRRPLPPALMRR